MHRRAQQRQKQETVSSESEAWSGWTFAAGTSLRTHRARTHKKTVLGLSAPFRVCAECKISILADSKSSSHNGVFNVRLGQMKLNFTSILRQRKPDQKKSRNAKDRKKETHVNKGEQAMLQSLTFATLKPQWRNKRRKNKRATKERTHGEGRRREKKKRWGDTGGRGRRVRAS